LALAGGLIWWWQPSAGGGGPVIPPVQNTGGWESGRIPTVRTLRDVPREAWPKYITLSDGRVLEAADADEYARIIGNIVAAENEYAARAIAEDAAAQRELLERLADLEADTQRLRIEAIIAEAVAVYQSMLRADDDAMILIMAQL